MQRISKTRTAPDAIGRILVVDDQRRVADVIAGVLRSRGHEVRVAVDGPSALEAALAFVPHLAFVDIGLPGMSGYEVAARLQAEPTLQHVSLVALSGYAADEIQSQARAAGFEHHLVKPPSLKTMDALIGAAVGAHSKSMPERLPLGG